MRKLIVTNIMSLDGYFEGPGRDVMALPMDGFFDEHNLERLRAADTLLLGASTYTGLKGYWPAVAANPEVSPAVAANRDVADIHRETGMRNNEIQKVVGATVLGGGTPAFGAGPVPPLRLVSTRRRDGSDNVLLSYEVVSRDE
jgi:hypothetical protein